jgi:Putative inner membrane protein (DUF1819)
VAAELRYTTQLQAGLGMVSETLELLRLWRPGLSAQQLSKSARADGLFARATARRTRNLVIEMFAPRFLVGDGTPAARVKYLIERQLPHAALVQLCFLQTARAQRVFRDFVIDVYWPRYSAGASLLAREAGERFIQRALDAGKMPRRWSASTVSRVSGYLLSCCADFGLLAVGGGKQRQIQRFSIRPDIALYLAYDLHFSGLGDMAVVRHADWKLFGQEPLDTIRLLQSLGRARHLMIQSAADVISISWRYKTMEDCLNAVAKG